MTIPVRRGLKGETEIVIETVKTDPGTEIEIETETGTETATETPSP